MSRKICICWRILSRTWRLKCIEVCVRRKSKTLFQWKQEHAHVNVLAFEANCHKESGFGELEEVCGFCLASHYFERIPPKVCRFCRAPIREARSISGLPEVVNQVWTLSSSGIELAKSKPGLFLVQKRQTKVEA
jgi:hypothetical protein